MSFEIIDGRKIADNLLDELSRKISVLKSKFHIVPSLAIIQVGDNPSSNIYVANKIKKCDLIGIKHFYFKFPEATHLDVLLKKIESINEDMSIHGMIAQLPMPDHIPVEKVINLINPEKDVDGFHPINIGKMLTDQKCFLPCTPQGCMKLIKSKLDDLSGKKAVIIGRSNIVGKPMSYLLLKENCTVTITHSKTKNLKDECQQADILIAAIGKREFIKKDWVKKGAIVIDVGINQYMKDGKVLLSGDVDFVNVKENASSMTPVPGGVGPMTIACLLKNTIVAACNYKNISYDDI